MEPFFHIGRCMCWQSAREVIKFICKDFWNMIFKKQVDQLFVRMNMKVTQAVSYGLHARHYLRVE